MQSSYHLSLQLAMRYATIIVNLHYKLVIFGHP